MSFELQTPGAALASRKRRRLTGADGVSDDMREDEAMGLVNNVQPISDVQEMERLIMAEINKLRDAGCVWPNGTEVLMHALKEIEPGHAWFVVRRSEGEGGNLSVSQPAGNKAFVFLYAEYLVIAFPDYCSA